MSDPKYFNARDWGGILNREQIMFLFDITSKLQSVEDGATADMTESEIETAYNDAVAVVTQAEAEAGTVTSTRRWTPERVKQAIAALEDNTLTWMGL